MAYLDWTGFDITDPANTKRFNLGAGDIRSAKSDLKDQLDILDGILYNTTIGVPYPYIGLSLPTGFLWCDGSSLSRTTYSRLFGAISGSLGTFTVTIASPGVVTLATHGLETGECVSLTTDGALPTGLSADTNYYVIYVTGDTFRLATSLANAIAGTAINTSGTQSGTHTLRHNPFGINGANNFYIPNLCGIVLKGAGSQSINGRTKTGPVLGAVEEDRFQGHWTDIFQSNGGGAGSLVPGYGAPNNNSTSDYAIDVNSFLGKDPITDGVNGTPRTGATTRENSVGVNYIIKY